MHACINAKGEPLEYQLYNTVMNLAVDIFCCQRLITGISPAYKTYCKFKIRLTVSFSLIYFSVQLKKSYFIFKDVLLWNNRSWDDKIHNNYGKLCPINLWKFLKRIVKYAENNDIFKGVFSFSSTVHILTTAVSRYRRLHCLCYAWLDTGKWANGKVHWYLPQLASVS